MNYRLVLDRLWYHVKVCLIWYCVDFVTYELICNTRFRKKGKRKKRKTKEIGRDYV